MLQKDTVKNNQRATFGIVNGFINRSFPLCDNGIGVLRCFFTII